MKKYKITICISLCLFMRSVQSYGNAFVVCKFYPNSSYHTTSRMHTKCILNNIQTIFHNKYQITFNVLTSHYTALITYSIHHFTHAELLCNVSTQTTNSFDFTQFTTCHINHLLETTLGGFDAVTYTCIEPCQLGGEYSVQKYLTKTKRNSQVLIIRTLKV